MTNWIRAASRQQLSGGPVVVNHPPHQIVVFQIEDSVCAIDNRCPHEGYPLAAGSVTSDGVLTCNWHNWKFRLSDGTCLLGGDHVRSYPAKLDRDAVWIDLADPSLESIRHRVSSGLRTAFEERDFGRICREVARLHFHGLEPQMAISKALEWAHDRFEFGTTHAIAATADWLGLADRLQDGFEPRLICLAESVDHLAFDSLRQPPYPYAPTGPEFDAEDWLAAVEGERSEAAEGMVARGLSDGMHWPEMEEAFVRAALAHYSDFGHSLIYVVKTKQLVDRLGPDVERFLLPPLARHLCLATREDLIPEFRDYAPAIQRLEPLTSRPQTEMALALETPFPVSTARALQWLDESLPAYPLETVYNALLQALGMNMLHYDTRYGIAFDRPVSQNISWLDFTHGITFSNAARAACATYPDLWPRALAQMACFLGRNRRFVDLGTAQDRWRVAEPDAFFDQVHLELLDHGLRDPIFSAHLIKTSMAVEGEFVHVSDSCGQTLLAALNRFLHSPIKMKHVRRLARQAIALVGRDFTDQTAH